MYQLSDFERQLFRWQNQWFSSGAVTLTMALQFLCFSLSENSLNNYCQLYSFRECHCSVVEGWLKLLY